MQDMFSHLSLQDSLHLIQMLINQLQKVKKKNYHYLLLLPFLQVAINQPTADLQLPATVGRDNRYD